MRIIGKDRNGFLHNINSKNIVCVRKWMNCYGNPHYGVTVVEVKEIDEDGDFTYITRDYRIVENYGFSTTGPWQFYNVSRRADLVSWEDK